MNSRATDPTNSSISTPTAGYHCESQFRTETHSTRRNREFRKAPWKPWISNFTLVVLMLLAFVAPNADAASISWYGNGPGGGDGVSWSDPHNWLGGVLPGANDDVTIGVVAGNPTIQITSPVAIKSLTCSEPLNMSAGSLSVTASSAINAPFTIDNATLTVTGASVTFSVTNLITNNSTVTVSGASATFSVTSSTSLSYCTLNAQNGATLSSSSLSALTGVNMSATGGAKILFPAVSGYTGSTGGDTTIQASGAGSRIDLSHLATFNGGGRPNYYTAYATHVLPTNGGEIDLAGAIDWNGGNLNDIALDNTGGILGVSGITSMANTTLTVSANVSLSFTALTALNGVNIIATGGAKILFPVVSGYTGSTGGDTTIQASGAGSRIDLSHLVTFNGGGRQNYYTAYATHVLPTNGGEIDLSGAIGINGGNSNDLAVTYSSASGIPFVVNGTSLANTTINFILGFAPTPGTSLMVVHNTGVEGTFTNLAQGQLLNLAFGGNTYSFRSNYLGGTGKDLVLDFLAPIVTTLPATSIGQTGATLNGTVNPNGLATTYHFEYGTDPNFAVVTSTTAQSAGSGTGAVPVQAPITGLNPNTQYYFRLVASNSAAPFPSTDAGLTFTTLPITYTVTPSAGAGGSISPNTPQVVNSGGSATFTGTPGTGYTVDKWLLDGTAVQTGGATYTLNNVTANHTVQVTFKVLQYTVTPSAGANGSISPNTPQTVNYNGSAIFTGTPGTGYTVDKWLLDGTAVQTGGTTYTLNNVTANHAVQVTFKVFDYTVTPSAGANGSISPNTAQTVNYNGSATFTGTPNTGYVVDKWLLDGIPQNTPGVNPPYTLSNVTANHTVQVTFKQLTYTVTPSAGANGSISPNTAQTVNYNGSVGFTGTPNTGYTVDQWLLDGTAVQTGGTSYTLNNVTANHTVQVTFKLIAIPFTVTPIAGPHGSISPNTPQNGPGPLSFTGIPDTGYTVDQWLLDGTAVQTGGTTYTLNNVTANRTVQVTFKLIAITFTVTPIAGPHGSISPNTPQNGPGPLVFTGIPDSGYMVNQWLLDGTPVQSGGAQFTLANVTANHTVKATFTTMSGWFDGFETYTLGTVPTPNWANSGNTAVQVENTVVSGGSKAVSLYGVVGGNWGALIHRQLNLAAPLLIECDVRNGTESLSGNHPFFVGVALNSGPSWTTNQRGLLYFAPAGGANNIYAGDPASSATPIIGHYTPGQWHHVAIAYERPDSATVKLSYWVDGSFLGSFLSQSYSYESSLSYLSLVSGEGTSWFDNVRVSQYAPITSTVYDLNNDWSDAANPNGVWSYSEVDPEIRARG